MASEITLKLTLITLVLTAALVPVLLLRLPLRRLFGAGQAYLIWALVPLTLFASQLPVPASQAMVAHVIPRAAPFQALASHVPSPDHHWQSAILIIWLLGAILSLIWFGLQHRYFALSLGKCVARNGLQYAEFKDVNPALTGIWLPRIVVPADFDLRYDESERNLIVAHERAHIRRGDVGANLLCALLQCFFWFHPLVHFAARCFRFDQELACDRAVMRKHPAMRRQYAEAMLKTHLAEFSTPLGCHWHSNHPLKERIMQLNTDMPKLLRRLIGIVLIGCLTMAGSYGAWAEQAGIAANPADTYRIALSITDNSGSSNPAIEVSAAQPAKITLGEGPDAASYSFTVVPVKDAEKDSVELNIVASKGGTVFDKPRILVHLGEPGKLSGKFGGNSKLDFSMEFAVSKVASR